MAQAERVTLRVFGDPAPQGSKSFMGLSKKGKGIMAESSKKVKPWREAVKFAALESVGSPRLEGPLTVDMTFYLHRGSSIPKWRIRPWKKPDLSKLIRSTEDALTDAGVWIDDAQVVTYICSKHYATHVPAGVVIEVRTDPGGPNVA